MISSLNFKKKVPELLTRNTLATILIGWPKAVPDIFPSKSVEMQVVNLAYYFQCFLSEFLLWNSEAL